MTTPTPGRITITPRALAAWALVGYPALHLMFAFFNWLLPGGATFSQRSASGDFTNLFVMAMPVVAVLLAVHVTPTLGGAKLISAVAVIEYAFSLLFGLFALLIGVGAVVTDVNSANDAFDVMRYFVLGLAGLALLAIAGWVAVRAYIQLGGVVPITIGRPSAPPPPPPA